jgi:hypothetical protein
VRNSGALDKAGMAIEAGRRESKPGVGNQNVMPLV